MQDKGLDNIYDLIAVRAIVKTIPECYALIGRLHSIVEPYKNRFKDYITHPKANGYQSIHSTVLFEGFPVEIQIRTEEMHQYAEYGIAAHWLYKEKRNKQDNLDVRLAWLRQMMENEDISIDEIDSYAIRSFNSELRNNLPQTVRDMQNDPMDSKFIEFMVNYQYNMVYRFVDCNGTMVSSVSVTYQEIEQAMGR